MQNEPDYYETKRAKAWLHKQELDKITSFGDRMYYWENNIGWYPDCTAFSSGEHAPFTLDVRPETLKDYETVYRCQIDYWRKVYAEEKCPVMAYNDLGKKDKGWHTIAFCVERIDDLKADFERRLSLVVRKRDMIESEIESVTKLLDGVATTALDNRGKEVSYVEGRCINKLRMHVNTLAPYGFNKLDKYELQIEPVALGKVWDRVYYEAYLKDMLKQLDEGVKVPNGIQYESFSELFPDAKTEKECVAVLRSYRPEKPILGTGLNWTGSKKDVGIIVAWIERMEGMDTLRP